MVNLLTWLLSRKSWIASPGVPNLGAMPTGLHQGILCGPIQFTSQLRIAGGIVHVVAGTMCKSYRYHPDLYLSYLKRQIDDLKLTVSWQVAHRVRSNRAIQADGSWSFGRRKHWTNRKLARLKKPALDDLFIGFHTAHEGAGKI